MKSLFILIFALTATAHATQDATKGVLPEVRLSSDNEDENQQRAMQSELLISKTETKAIESLTQIINKKKGTQVEPELLYRLAELYMRQAKSGRFFDLNQAEARKQQNLAGVQNQKTIDSLKKAIVLYDRLQKDFPKFKYIDSVLFNNAMASLQTQQVEKSKRLYEELINSHPRSSVLPDALLEVGEIYYQQQNFSTALERFKLIEKYPNSKAYPYGLYKSAWCFYNLKQTDLGINQLLQVVKSNPEDVKDQKKYNLRKEALRDLALFVGESMSPEKLYSFFEKIETDEELGETMLALSQLFESHSKFNEINVVLREFIQKKPFSEQTAKCYVKLIENNETLKKRDVVIEDLKKLALECQTSATASTCNEQFRTVSLDISKKWWEIWLKNKANKEFSNLTAQAFENLLTNESSDRPDSKSRYAYAELLFQTEKYDKASEQYEEVSKHNNIERNLGHDALYGAIFSIEKLLAKNDDDLLSDKQKQLATRYIQEYKNGEHIAEIKFKLGFFDYKQNLLDPALAKLSELTAANTPAQIKVKSEDIMLDIYNIKKDFPAIQNLAKKIIKTTSEEKRKNAMQKILEEAQYSQLQLDAEKLPKEKQIAQLKQFSKEHSNTKLGQDSLWQSISLSYTNEAEVQAAEYTADFIKQYPNDKRNQLAINDAAKAFLDAGRITESIKMLRELKYEDASKSLKNKEMICDLLTINNDLSDAETCYKNLIGLVEKNKKVELLNKVMKILEQTNNTAELKEIQNQILKDNIEPYATQILISNAQTLLENNKESEAFNLSLKINARPIDADLRAEARLIQAVILEKEFVRQSVKARENKFAMVLSLKTEKLDKAYTAYSTTIKMSKSDKIQLRALEGIDRLYSHYIESITHMPLPTSLIPDEQIALKKELLNATAPFAEKKKENALQIKKLSKLSTNQSESLNWAETNIESTIEPRVQFPSVKQLADYYPTQLNLSAENHSRIENFNKKCDSKEISATSIATCIALKNWSEAEKMSYTLSAKKETRAIGMYYLSQIAQNRNLQNKALWYIDKALALDEENPVLNYQKGKVLFSVEGINSGLVFFEKALSIKNTSKEVAVLAALRAFSDRDYITTCEEISRLSLTDVYNYGMSKILVEATALKGEYKEAIALATKFLKAQPDSMMWIEQARIEEQFLIDKDLAIISYQKALSLTKEDEQKNWLKNKIEFLKANKHNQITLNVGR